ncbi:MAG: CPBP family intramembrane metalloprotease [Maribacter sp.]|nr:CPBP family intramembrane metalloprotease [Maribacter sp.]
MLQTVWTFLKYPKYEEDENTNFDHRFLIFGKLLGISILFSLTLGMSIGIFELAFRLNFGTHAIDELFEKFSMLGFFALAVFVAPIIEELIFRGPMFFFKHTRAFKYIFYALTLSFGFYHLSNFDITKTTLFFSPLLVSPQLSVGVFLGYIRVRFGLVWSMSLHAAYNLVLIGPVLLLRLLNIPFE